MDQPPTLSPAGTTSPAGMVAAANALLAGADDVLWAARTPEDLIAANEQIEMLRSHLAALQASIVTEVQTRGIAKSELAWSSTGDWFTHTAGQQRRAGHRTVRQAPVLVNERVATHQALTDGEISPEQAAVIVDAVDTLPHNEELRCRAEQALLEQATSLDATALAVVGKRIAAVVDPDRADRKLEAQLEAEERAAHHRRFLAITPDDAGGVWLKGRGTAEDAALIKAALLPLTKPNPATGTPGPDAGSGEDRDDVLPDPRDHGARLWDALVQVAQHALDTDLAPDAHGARPRLAVTTDLDTLLDQLHGRERETDQPFDPERIDWATLGHDTDPLGPVRGGLTCDGADLSPATIRRLACDADLIPVALGTCGQVLDVGRANRLVTPALWTALVCRDRHCAFPACTRPPVMCHAHHIIHWADGGTTALFNLVMLCGQHHRTIHESPWQVRLDVRNGRPEFKPPPRRGVEQGWTRSRPRRE